MILARATLILGAAMYGAFGLLLALRPELLDQWLGIRAEGVEARTELRAFYGGVELGAASFLVLCAVRSHWVAPGCVLLLLVNAGIALARVLGFALDASATPKLLAFLAVEVVLVALAAVALLRLRTASQGDS